MKMGIAAIVVMSFTAGAQDRLADIEKRLDLIEENTLPMMSIVSGTEKDQNVMIKYSGHDKPRKLMWIKIKNKVILPEWFTEGKEAQKIKHADLPWAWRRGVIGVYKMDYTRGPVKEAFKGFIVIVGKKEYNLTKD